MDQDYFDSNNLYKFLYKYKKHILTVALLAAVSSAVVSLLLPNKFKSKVVIYPSSTSSVAKALVAENFSGKTDIMEFGDEEKSEQLLEILESEKIRGRVIDRFKLLEHYKIDTSAGTTPIFNLNEEYSDNIVFTRNRNMAVEIQVLDESADTAALIANYTAKVLDDVVNEIQKERAKQGFELVKKVYESINADLKNAEDTLQGIMEKGVLDVESQSEAYATAHAKALSDGKLKVAKEIQNRMDILAKYGSKSLSLVNQLEYDRDRLSVVKSKYEEAKLDAESRIKTFFTVATAYPAEKKSYPIRWLIVLVSTVLATFFGIIVIFFYEKMQIVKSNL